MIKCFESFFRMLFKSAQNSSIMSTLGPHQGSIQDCFAGRRLHTPGVEQWNGIILMQENLIKFSNDWTNLFSTKMESIFVFVLCFKYK